MAGDLDLVAVRDALAAEVAGALGEGYQVTTDPRGLNPPCVLIGVPTLEVSNVRTVTLVFPVHVVAPGPGNDDAVRWMLGAMSLLVPGVTGPFLEVRPGPYDTSERILPALTALVTRSIAFC